VCKKENKKRRKKKKNSIYRCLELGQKERERERSGIRQRQSKANVQYGKTVPPLRGVNDPSSP
jgi:hypothetical protein